MWLQYQKHTKIAPFNFVPFVLAPKLSTSFSRMPPPSRQSPAKSPLRGISPKPNGAAFTTVITESKLVQAIQALDSTWRSSKHQPRLPASKEEVITDRSTPSALSGSLRNALCTLLEIAACLDKPECFGSKTQLVTVCTARVLGCLKRFVEGCAGMEPPLGGCCGRMCEQRLVRLTLLSILFCMCREPDIAKNVVKEDLHTFLIRMCTTSETLKNPDVSADLDSQGASEVDTFDPYDLMIAIDPFDWCYQPLCTRLMKENTIAFFLPMGVRSLTCLLRGIAIPTDEVSEFEQQLHVDREKSSRHQKLPSIFAFPQNDADEGTMVVKFRLTPLCCKDPSTQHEQRDTRALWSLVLNEGSRVHLALRSLIALAIHIPQLSQEYRALLNERDYVRRVLASTWLIPESVLSWLNPSECAELLPFQLIPNQTPTLKRIACCALSLFAEEQNLNPIAAKRASTGGQKMLSPISKKCGFTKVKQPREHEPQSIQRRLNAATKAASTEFTQWENEHVLSRHSPDREQNHRRLAIRKMCTDVESLRRHLIGSLEVLCSGRQHPNPQQSFSEWIKSLPTLETLERERQYQQEMRQRQILEQQYQREALRRRERDDSKLMHANDYNVPGESELSMQQAKHEQFLWMRAEIWQLERSILDDDIAKTHTEANDVRKPMKKEKLAIQERQRLLELEAQRREGRELEKMRREDLYYVERILEAKAKTKEEQKMREKSGVLQKNIIEEQQKHIVRMRFLDEEKRITERESVAMRVEDLVGRQMRFREAEKAKEELHNEWRERKTMQVEEHNSRVRWTLWERALLQQQQEELKQQRAEARRLKRQQEREEREIKAAWIESWDENGNKYYYNSMTGISQWEAPIQTSLKT